MSQFDSVSFPVVVWLLVLLGACSGSGAGDVRGLEVSAQADLDSGFFPDPGAREPGDLSGFSDLAPEVGPDLDLEPDLDAAGQDLAELQDLARDEVQNPCLLVDPDGDSDQDGLNDQDECLAGTDPLVADTDRDGYLDGEEVALGTNPADPSSALAWHPELAGRHPRLFFGPEDLPELRSRIAEEAEPALLYQWIRAQCQATAAEVPSELFDCLVMRNRARIAQACGFQGLIEQDPVLIARAADLLAAGFPDPRPINQGAVPSQNYDLYEAEALVAAMMAWDYIAGSGLLGQEALDQLRARLVERVDFFREIVHSGATFLLLSMARNNHQLKVYGALGLAAMALNDRPTAAGDLGEAIAGLDFVLMRFQMVPSGGYAEGWSYLQYGEQSFLPLMAAHHRYSGGEALPYHGSGLLIPEDELAGQVAVYPDPVTRPELALTYQLAQRTTEPHGLTSNFDDANPACLHWPVLARFFEEDSYMWSWRRPSAGRSCEALEDLCLISWQPVEDPGPPSGPLDFVSPDAGLGVLRSGWEEDSVLLLGLGEQGPISLSGLGHEHPDPTGFMIWAFGEYLALDPGYINWEHHDLVKQGRDHNLIMVDGQGPEVIMDSWVSVEGEVGPLEQGEDWTGFTLRTQYLEVEIERRILRYRDLFFVVRDQLTSAQPHAYTFQLSGHGGGETPDSEFLITDLGASWRKGEVRLDAGVFPFSGEPQIGSRLEEHSHAWGQWETNEMLMVTSTMGADAGFLTVLVPRLDETPGEIELLVRSGDLTATLVTVGQQRFLVADNRSGEELALDPGWGAESLVPGLTVLPGPQGAN